VLIRGLLITLAIVTTLFASITSGSSATQNTASAQSSGDATGVTSVVLFAVDLPADWVPPGEATLTLSRWRWGQGARVFLPAGYYPAGINLSYVLTGSLVVHVDGPMLVGRSKPGDAPGPLEAVPNGDAVTLNQGDVFSFRTESTLHARNARQVESIVLTTLLLATGAAGDFPDARTDSFSIDVLASLDEAAWAAVPRGSVNITVTRTLAQPGAELEPYEVSREAPELLVVESGLLELWTDTDFDRAPDAWEPVIPSTAFDDYVILTPSRVIRASRDAPPPSAENGFADLAPGPLLILTLDVVVNP
jgi:hypothetical protein